MYVFICGGHHDSDRIAVLVMVSKADSIVLYLSSCSIMYTCQNKDFLPSLRVLRQYLPKKKKKVQGDSLIRAVFFAENYISEQSAN